MTFPPQGYIIGAAKAGTTTLASLLDRHPDLAVATTKEPDFFTGQHHCGLDWYRRQFPEGRAKVLIDASTSYGTATRHAAQGSVPAAIEELRPDARLIMLVREPVARAWSSYLHFVRTGEERRGFLDALADPASVHVRAGLYHARLTEFLRHFDREAILVLDFGALARNPMATARKAAAFLGVDPEALPEPGDGGTRRNGSFQWTGLGAIMRDTLGQRGVNRLTAMAQATLPGTAVERLKRLASRPAPEPTPRDAARCRELFGEDAARLAADFGVETRVGRWWTAASAEAA